MGIKDQRGGWFLSIEASFFIAYVHVAHVGHIWDLSRAHIDSSSAQVNSGSSDTAFEYQPLQHDISVTRQGFAI